MFNSLARQGITVLALAACPWAQAQDMLAARSLAATCASCHGTSVRAGGGIAVLAGRPAEKIVAQVEAFRDGSKPSTVMQQIAKGYSSEQIRLAAAWFATQKAAPP